MSRHGAEAFGQVIYAPELSYDDLLGRENQIKSAFVQILEEFQAEFITFESEGDRTFFQCALPVCTEKNTGLIAASMKKWMDDHTECKIFFVDTLLFEHYFYALTQQESKQIKLALPEAGPIDQALIAKGG